MDIVRANENDLKQVSVLFDQYRQFYKQISNVEGAYHFLVERYRKQESILFVAKQGEQYVGFVQLYPTFSSVAMKDAFILNDLFVINDFRQKGVGKELMKKAFSFANDKGARFICLETATSNIKAQQLYEKMGMTSDSSTQHYIYYWD
ncbi:GNAT family N-acetyltransferase [Bacillus altitudinis]|uniref:GNAT family N-acetyltransferase n=3 Tax=Bacillaceae TaxID=186817 RepID=A0AB39JAR8_9BACI|nr:GNAT family N-acetyltransferase [Bacillus altitudinis]MBR0630094.1 GNAT family N-acetyltransferase [Bacillus altitudinis C101]OQP18334.1 GNAT family N-acetyltransferase [Bacillus stratosphericus]MCL6796706.1 GNAT family N-acetyltransferase [Bacillus altitudinis]MCY7451676.1 GNAT family N-acetyltransferase [Bacillus altitudinis]MDF9414453.1 GNAT family N-acetyltransferase [Bacillus altitudinis]